MHTDEIHDALVDALSGIQSDSGRVIPEITDATHPIGDLEGFDSLNAVEVSMRLSEALNMKIDFELLVSKSYGFSPTVGDIVERIFQVAENSKGDHHEQLSFRFKSKFYRR